jgi:hypothetical protein
MNIARDIARIIDAYLDNASPSPILLLVSHEGN